LCKGGRATFGTEMHSCVCLLVVNVKCSDSLLSSTTTNAPATHCGIAQNATRSYSVILPVAPNLWGTGGGHRE